MQLIYAKEPLTIEARKGSIFLAGPTPRDQGVMSWRPEAIRILEGLHFQGCVLIPEPRDGVWHGDYEDQIEWEANAMDASSIIVFWIDRNMRDMPGLTTNDEWGFWKSSGKVVIGTPPTAERVRYQRWWATRLGVPQFDTLADTLTAAMLFIKPDIQGISS